MHSVRDRGENDHDLGVGFAFCFTIHVRTILRRIAHNISFYLMPT